MKILRSNIGSALADSTLLTFGNVKWSEYRNSKTGVVAVTKRWEIIHSFDTLVELAGLGIMQNLSQEENMIGSRFIY